MHWSSRVFSAWLGLSAAGGAALSTDVFVDLLAPVSGLPAGEWSGMALLIIIVIGAFSASRRGRSGTIFARALVGGYLLLAVVSAGTCVGWRETVDEDIMIRSWTVGSWYAVGVLFLGSVLLLNGIVTGIKRALASAKSS